MKTQQVTRKELYDLVWSKTLAKLTEEYAYTNEGIKKICKEFDVSMPGNGYWSKLKFDSKIKKTKLNSIFNGIDKIELILREQGSLVNIDQNPLTIRTKEIESDTKAPLKVPEKLKNPDIVTIQTQEFWKSTKDKPFYSRSEKVVFHIRVGKEHQNRALLFMDSLAKLLRYRGHTFAKEYNETKILIKDIFIEFDLREASKRIPSEKPYGTSDYVPTGELIFKIGRYSGEKEWRDGKTKLEDLGLKYTEPAVYEDIVSKIRETKEEQDAYIKDISDVLKKSLDNEGIDYIIKGRPKSIYSIRRKMKAQGVSFDEVYDKFALRIVYKSNPHDEKFLAWKIYSIVTDHYRPSPSRLRDWISSPKSTGYEALHITVMGPKGRWVEIQVRSERMDEIAEKGYAAHYKYKNGATEESGLDVWLNLLREALENAETNAVDFVEDFKMNLYSKEIFVFTPKGDIKSLPKGATSLDFAFGIHSEIGIRTRGTRVNGKLVPLNYELKSGDQIEVITSPNQKPTTHWLDYVTTARAKTKIKNVLNEDTKKIGEEGKELLTRKLKHLKITLNEKTVNELVNFFKLKTSLDLFYRVGIGAIENQQLKDYAAQKSNTFISFFKNKIKRNISLFSRGVFD